LVSGDKFADKHFVKRIKSVGLFNPQLCLQAVTVKKTSDWSFRVWLGLNYMPTNTHTHTQIAHPLYIPPLNTHIQIIHPSLSLSLSHSHTHTHKYTQIHTVIRLTDY